MTAARLRGWLPSSTALLLTAATALVAIVALAHGLVDTDYYWHITTGRLIAETGQIPTTDPYSFTYAGQPWTDHEWLGQLLLYWAVSGLGTSAALLLFGVASMLGVAAVGAVLRLQRQAGNMPLLVGVGTASWIMLSFATLRPQVLSFGLLGGLLALLLAISPSHRRWLLLCVPLFALWVNLHGLWVVGLGVLGVYVLFTLLGRSPMRTEKRWVLVISLASAAATLLNPAGLEGTLYPLRYVQPGSWGLAHISEWMSPNFHMLTFLPVLVLVMLVLGVGLRGVPGWLATLALLGVVGALLAQRNAPVAAVLSLPAVVLGLGGLRLRAPRTDAEALGRRLMELALAIIVVAGTFVAGPRIATVSATNSTFPVAAFDRLVSIAPTAQVLTEYGWGGYAIYRLYADGGRVFVDGRNDMYPTRILDDYLTLHNADPGWQELLRSYGVTAIVLRPTTPLVRGPAQEAGWCEAYRDATAVLLLPSCP